MAKKKMESDSISGALKDLKDLIAALRAKDVAAASSAFFSFIDEMRQAFTGTPITMMRAGSAVEKVPGDCDWDDCADQCEKLMNSMKGMHASAVEAGFDWTSLIPLILQILSLFAKK